MQSLATRDCIRCAWADINKQVQHSRWSAQEETVADLEVQPCQEGLRCAWADNKKQVQHAH